MSFGVSQATGSQGLPSVYTVQGISTTTPVTSVCNYFDDFIGTTYSSQWTKAGAGTAATGTFSSGTVVFDSGAVLNQDVTFTHNGVRAVSGTTSTKKVELEISGWVANIAGNDAIYRMGANFDATHYYYVEVDNATNGSTNWFFVRDDGLGRVATDLGITPSINSAARDTFLMYGNAAGSIRVYHKLQGAGAIIGDYTLITTITTSLPTTGALQPYFYVKTTSGVNRTMVIDYIRLSQLRADV